MRLAGLDVLRAGTSFPSDYAVTYANGRARRKRIEYLWTVSTTKERWRGMADARETARRLGVTAPSDIAWEVGAGRHVGLAYRHEAAHATGRSDWEGQGEASLLSGWDLPGRLSCVALVDAKGKLDVAPVDRHSGPGWALLGASTSNPVILPDLLSALRMAGAAWAEGKPSPVLAPWSTDARPESLIGLKVTMWSAGPPTPASWATAAGLGARVAVDGPNADVPGFLSRVNPPAWLDKIRSASRPWPEALNDCLAGMAQESADSLATTVVGGVDSRLKEMSAGGAAAAASAKRLADRAGREVKVRRARVSVAAGRTFRNGDLAADAVLRIDRQLTGSAGDYYQGEVTWHDAKIPFLENRSVIERSTYAWMKRLIADRCGGAMAGDPMTGRAILSAALVMDPPALGKLGGRVGWDPSTGKFVLAGFTLGPGGVVDTSAGADPFVDPITPTSGIEPRVLTAEDRIVLATSGPAGAAAVAVATAVMANVLSDLSGAIPAGIVVSEKSGIEVARACGCAGRPAPNRKGLDGAIEIELANGWPVAYVPKDAGQTREWASAPGPRRAVAVGSGLELAAARLVADWWAVDTCPVTGTVMAAAGRMAFTILDKLSRQNWSTGLGSINLRVLAGMAAGESDPVADAAVGLIDRAVGVSAAGAAFARLVTALATSGYLVEGMKLRKAAGHRACVIHAGRATWIPKATFYQGMRVKGLAPPDDTVLTGRLMEAGCVSRQEARGSDRPVWGWVVARDWWEAAVAASTMEAHT